MAPSVRVTLTDISSGGAQFVATREQTVGQCVVLEVQAIAGATKPQPLEAVVRWVVADRKPGQFRVGCARVTRLDYYHLLQYS